MTTASSTAGGLTDAAELVRFGCRPRLRPLADTRYRELLQRYRMDNVFRGQVDAIAQGLDLDVIAAHPQEGLVVHAHEDGLFGYRLKDDIRRPAEQRLIVGLVHVAIAARVYPTAVDLEEESVKRVSVQDVEGFLRHLVEQLRQAAQGPDGLAVPHAELDTAWRLYAKRPSGRPTASGRRVTDLSTQGIIQDVLDWLVHQGMASPAPELGAGQYRLLHRFRLQVREAASLSAFDVLCDIRRAQLAATGSEEE